MMKKVLRKITMLICVATLLIVPATALASPYSVPVLTSEYPEFGFKMYEYRPDALDLQPGQQAHLIDNGAAWLLPTGKSLFLACNVPSGLIRVQVHVSGYGFVTDFVTHTGFTINQPGDYTDRYVHVVVTALEPSKISNYSCTIN
jgi:hypothetical protein